MLTRTPSRLTRRTPRRSGPRRLVGRAGAARRGVGMRAAQSWTGWWRAAASTPTRAIPV